MDGNSYIWIFRNVDSFKELCFSACTVARKHKKTGLCVRAVCSSDKINEIMFELIDNITLRNCFSCPPLMSLTNGTWLVHALKNEMLVVILEFLSDLRPYLEELWLHFIVSLSKIASVYPVFVMNIKDDVHIVLDTVINNFLYTSHPLRIDVVIFVKMLEPCSGDTNCIEALGFKSVEQSLISLRASPCCLSLNACVSRIHINLRIISTWLGSLSVHCVTEIPAYLHILCDLESCHCLVCRNCIKVVSRSDSQ